LCEIHEGSLFVNLRFLFLEQKSCKNTMSVEFRKLFNHKST
jgi:hypothetical protein